MSLYRFTDDVTEESVEVDGADGIVEAVAPWYGSRNPVIDGLLRALESHLKYTEENDEEPIRFYLGLRVEKIR